MRVQLSALAVLGLTFATLNAAHAVSKVDPALVSFGRGETSNKTALVIGVLNSPAGEVESDRPSRYDSNNVLRFLKNRAKASWNDVEMALTKNNTFNKSIRLVRLHWINNSFIAQVTPDGLKALAEASGVKKIYSNRKVYFEKPYREGQAVDSSTDDDGKVPYDFKETNLVKLLSEAPQITGQGVLVGSVDTGVDGKHPALSGKIAAFYDGALKKPSEPKDYDTHGTHTSGTMVGGDRSKVLIGMAPGAKLIASGPLQGYDMMLKNMEFMLDPSGRTEAAEMPRAVNNSWHCGGAPDIELFYRAIASWEAAGILPVFSAGNAGPKPGSITPCHEHPSVIAVGATSANGKAANFSSRGPAKYKGQLIQKPDLTAPGDKIRSTLPNGQFGDYSGTSMAAPHVTGATALLFQIEPKLTPAQVRAILVKTATPTNEDGSAGKGGNWNATYGFGKLDIYAAAKAALSLHKERLGIEEGPLDLLANLFTTPSRIDVADLLADPGRLETADLEMPAAFEGTSSDWATPAAIWN